VGIRTVEARNAKRVELNYRGQGSLRPPRLPSVRPATGQSVPFLIRSFVGS
jgi:hypothetical protein